MRPNWGLIGHTWAVDMLRRHIAARSVRHAYLFIGPPGVGRRTLALRFVQALLCSQPPAAGEFCGDCRNCRSLSTLSHPDLVVVQAEREGGILKVDQVREVRRLASLKPYQTDYRIALFLRFQEANDSAANALLKTLEEAPEHLLLLLTADAVEALLPTIVSRCEVLRLRPIPYGEIERLLLQGGVEPERARLIAHLSGGRPGVASRMADDPSVLEFRRQRLEELQQLLSASRREKFAYVETLARERDLMRQTLLIWLSFWRDVFLQVAGAGTPPENVDRVSEIAALAARLDLATARRRMVETEQALQRLNHNVNARLLAEVLLLSWTM